MVEKKSNGKDHAFKRIQSDVKSGSLNNVIVLCGTEQYLIRWSLDLIKSAYIKDGFSEIDYVTLKDDSCTAEKVISHCDTVSMLSEKKIVAVDGDYLFSEKNIPKGSENDRLLSEYLERVPNETILVFKGEPEGKKNGIYEAVKKHGSFYSFDALDRKTLRMFVKKRLRLSGSGADSSVCDTLLDVCGYFNRDIEYDLDQLVNDIDKVAALSDDGMVTEKNVLEVFGGGLENNVFLFIDALSRNNKSECFRRLDDILSADNNIFRILSLVVSQMELIFQIREMLDEGRNTRDMLKVLKVHEYRFKKAAAVSRKIPLKNCRKMLLRAYDIDKSVKTGFMDQRLAMEYYIAGL